MFSFIKIWFSFASMTMKDYPLLRSNKTWYVMIIIEKLGFSKEKNRLETAHWTAAQAQYNTLWIIFRYFSVIWETTQILLSGMFMMTFITDFLQRLLCFPNFYISHSQWGVFVHNFHYLRSSFMILWVCCHSPLCPHTITLADCPQWLTSLAIIIQ